MVVGAVLLAAAWSCTVDIADGMTGNAALRMLDKLLPVPTAVALLYTIRVSLRERTPLAEPVLVVGRLAGIRGVVAITAEAWRVGEAEPEVFRRAMLELGLLTIPVVALVTSISPLRRFGARRQATAGGRSVG